MRVRMLLWCVCCLGVVMALGACSGESEIVEELVVTAAPAPEPVFEPAGSPGLDSFFPLEEQFAFGSSQLEAASAEVADLIEQTPTVPTLFESDTQSMIAALAVTSPTEEQVKSGLYGGTAENTCDPERLIQYLLEHPDKGQVWADVQGIRFVDIPEYVRTLTPAVLEDDRLVLNHGFDKRGHAIPIVSTLAKGTAVLVDENGDVRTRCYCGNPILPYVPVDYQPPKCLDYYSVVYVAPNERQVIDGVPRFVRGTSKLATYENVRWAEVSWGDSTTGWVRAHEAADRYCKPIETVVCVGSADVFSTPGAGNSVGAVTKATVSVLTPDVQGWSLIKYIGTSGWIQTSQLGATNCVNEVGCVSANAGVYDTVGLYGNQIVGSGQPMRLRYTGQSYNDPGGNGTYRQAYISYPPPANRLGYVRDKDLTTLPDTDCQHGVICTPFDVDTPVYQDATSTTVIGRLWYGAAPVLGSPTNNRVEVTWGNLTAWVDLADVNVAAPTECEARIVCVQFHGNGNVFDAPPPAGATLTPPGGPTPVLFTGKVHFANGTTYREFTSTVVAGPAWVETALGYDVLPWQDCVDDLDCYLDADKQPCIEPVCVVGYVGNQWRARAVWADPSKQLNVSFGWPATHTGVPQYTNPTTSPGAVSAAVSPLLPLPTVVQMTWADPAASPVRTGTATCGFDCSLWSLADEIELPEEHLPARDDCLEVECSMVGDGLTIPDTSGGTTTVNVTWSPTNPGTTLDFNFDWATDPDEDQYNVSGGSASSTSLGYNGSVTVSWFSSDGQVGVLTCRLCVSDIVYPNGLHECCLPGEPRVPAGSLCCLEGDLPLVGDPYCCPPEDVAAGNCCADGQILAEGSCRCPDGTIPDPTTGICPVTPPITPTPTPEAPTPTATPEPPAPTPTVTPTPPPPICDDGFRYSAAQQRCVPVTQRATATPVPPPPPTVTPTQCTFGIAPSGECYVVCEAGALLGRDCVCIGEGTTPTDDRIQCQVVCPSGLVQLSVTECGVPEVPTPVTCPAGSEFRDGQCLDPLPRCDPPLRWNPQQGRCTD